MDHELTQAFIRDYLGGVELEFGECIHGITECYIQGLGLVDAQYCVGYARGWEDGRMAR